MKLTGIPFEAVDFDSLPPTRHAGERGFALWQTREVGNVRARVVRYSPGYLADHWCERGHALFVLVVPVSDTTLLHARAAVDWSLQG